MNIANKKDRAKEVRNNLTNPFANTGMNSFFTQGFQSIQFCLTNAANKKEAKPFAIIPKYVQVQAALYLGCRRISCFSYSKPATYGNEIDFSGDFLKFYKPRDVNTLRKQQE